jgi:hypothetical protein
VQRQRGRERERVSGRESWRERGERVRKREGEGLSLLGSVSILSMLGERERAANKG